MKNIITLGFFVMAIALLMPSCKKSTNVVVPFTKPDSLMFGRYDIWTTLKPSGQTYMLANNMLYAFPTMYFRTTGYLTRQQLPDSLYNIARYLIDSLPPYLLQYQGNGVIGCPGGCNNGSIIQLCAYTDTTMKSWQISTDTAQLPAALKQYVWRAGIIIDQL